MTRRSRSIPPPSTIDRDMPHQVALPDDICMDRNYTLIRRFLDERSMSCRTRAVTAIWEDGKQEQWRLHCFADREVAVAFFDHFGGVAFDPKRDRENGHPRGVWRRQGAYERILEMGPLSVPEALRD
ncbi:hypothetical protein LB572_29360 [Mesorhizobium sp. BH1-1-5]|uniref:hypothetical protein n=1 Tax=unclassified Mesorhizobium TaxID=325217 RepID=UPI001127065C|nr:MULTISPECIES: hypothetical protein [unclassified Mesorhizobium]MBZ9991205.1 hypothetical protein [Mesorhizobium sp. BH1-1-5]TPJ74646.1 hypothetical protein FJ471_01445 [Mesorhizobium sp. B2-7-1]